jgi:hypothetical protein
MEQTPAASTEQTPAASTEQTPAANTEQTPAASTEQAPAVNTENAPAPSIEQAPATSAEQAPAASTEKAPTASTEQAPASNNTVGQSSESGSTGENPNGCHDWEKEVAEAAKSRMAEDHSQNEQANQPPAPAPAEGVQPSGEYQDVPADRRYGEAVSPSVTEQSSPRSEGELFARQPGELLSSSDQQLLRTLQALGEEAADSRCGTVSDYLHGLGQEAAEFSSRFENATGLDSASLGDNLPGLAAFLASYRLVQQGKSTIDEAIQSLHQGLENRSQSWADRVRELTTGATDETGNATGNGNSQPSQGDTTSNAVPVMGTVAKAAVQTLSDFGAAVWSLACQMASTDWKSSL